MAAHVYIHAKKLTPAFLLIYCLVQFWLCLKCFFFLVRNKYTYVLFQLFWIDYRFLRTSFLLSLVFNVFLSSTSAKSRFPMHFFVRLFTVLFLLVKGGRPSSVRQTN